MADDSKQKDELDDNINQDNPGDIHEADDTFGLPDIDYDPIEPSRNEPLQEEPTPEEPPRYEPEPVEAEQPPSPIAEDETQNVDQPYMYASRTEESDENREEQEYRYDSSEPDPEHLSSVEAEESAEPVHETYYHTSEGEEVVSNTDYSASMEDDHRHEEEKSAYVPGSYTPPKDNSNRTGMIVGILIVLVLLLVGVWYFMSYRPEQIALEKDRLAQEQRDQEAAEAQRLAQEEEAQKRAAAAEAARLAELERQQAEATPEIGTIETISSRTGRYYVVVASAVDGDLAMDYANKLIQDGYNIKIIQPYGSVIFHRVAIRDLDSWAEAANVANDLKGQYGEGVWVKKY
jgi:hypothetical protein